MVNLRKDPTEERWQAARERLWSQLRTYFECEIACGKVERNSHIDNILERYIKPEFIGLLQGAWSVWRQDDNGNSFEIERNLSFESAQSKAEELEARGHKQYYWIKPTDSE